MPSGRNPGTTERQGTVDEQTAAAKSSSSTPVQTTTLVIGQPPGKPVEIEGKKVIPKPIRDCSREELREIVEQLTGAPSLRSPADLGKELSGTSAIDDAPRRLRNLQTEPKQGAYAPPRRELIVDSKHNKESEKQRLKKKDLKSYMPESELYMLRDDLQTPQSGKLRFRRQLGKRQVVVPAVVVGGLAVAGLLFRKFQGKGAKPKPRGAQRRFA